MKKDLVDILACPICKGNLEFKIEGEDGKEIITGSLVCTNCSERYTIEEGLPNLLPTELRE
jgi:uncharacterized protein YbaR (Trm112 family)|tara:strand:- start:259 stop:441 length:183 start_codon:yes stop_codon:yes gene_type:complete